MTNDKEKVLEIKITQINDEYSSWYIEKINRHALGDYICEDFKSNNR